jgi:hypothetical protein
MESEKEEKAWAPPGAVSKPEGAKKRHVELVEQHRQDLYKFDYYFAAVALGVLSFSLTAYKAPPFQLLKFMHTASWGCYLLAFLFSVARIERLIGIRSTEVKRQSDQWYRDAFKENVEKEVLPAVRRFERVEDLNWYKSKLEEHEALEKKFIALLDSLNRSGKRYYDLMLISLVLGLTLAGTAKIFEVLW